MVYAYVFVVAVLLWAVISITIVVANGDKLREEKAAKRRASLPEAGEEPDRLEPAPRLSLGDGDRPWEEQLGGVPGVTGWAVMDPDAGVRQASDGRMEEVGESLLQLIRYFQEHAVNLGDEPVRMLELETERGNVMVLFPKREDVRERLILFIDDEAYKGQLRERLFALPWESGWREDGRSS